MLRPLLSGFLAAEFRALRHDIRRRLTGALVVVAAGFLLMLALVVALVALYQYLALFLLGWQAALAIAAALALAALILALVGRSLARPAGRARPVRHREKPPPPSDASVSLRTDVSGPAPLVIGLLVAGFALGRNLRR